jgi:hypothetical protein
LLTIKRLDDPDVPLSRLDLLSGHMVNIYRPDEKQMRPGRPVPGTTHSVMSGDRPVVLRMRDAAQYVVFTDGSFRRVPRRRRFHFGVDNRQLSGRQLRMMRKRVARSLRAERAEAAAAAGTPVAG